VTTLDPRRTVPCFVLAYLSVWTAIAAGAGTGNLLIEQPDQHFRSTEVRGSGRGPRVRRVG